MRTRLSEDSPLFFILFQYAELIDALKPWLTPFLAPAYASLHIFQPGSNPGRSYEGSNPAMRYKSRNALNSHMRALSGTDVSSPSLGSATRVAKPARI